jgi:aminopeptidase YwaD
MQEFPKVFGNDDELWSDFLALCSFGGRLAGTPGEKNARDWAACRLAAIPHGEVIRHPTAYTGWSCSLSELHLLPSGDRLDATALLTSAETPAGGLDLEVVDCGRGTPDDIRAIGPRLEGRVALVRHDYMFGTSTVHRRVKLAAAIDAGAAAFLIAATEPGVGSVSGSGVANVSRRVPALGISAEAAEILAAPGTRVRIKVGAQFLPGAKTETILLDIPGIGPDRVVLSAHSDGHAAGESALDNASGVALALALARRAAPYIGSCPRGLTVAIFSAEEWALTGSKVWLAGLSGDEHKRLLLNLNLDTIVGGSEITALTSDFPKLEGFLRAATLSTGFPLNIHEPSMPNSDHANFAALGIPAFRLVSGFNEPDSRCKFVLTKLDRSDVVTRDDFSQPAHISWSILRNALTHSTEALKTLSQRDLAPA